MPVQFGGPIWAEAIHDCDFVKGLLEQVKGRPDQYNTSDRILGFLTVISEVGVHIGMVLIEVGGADWDGSN